MSSEKSPQLDDDYGEMEDGRDSMVSLDLGARIPSWALPMSMDGKPPKAFELVDIQVKITAADTVTMPGKKPYTAYKIELEAGLASWSTSRRYTDFFYLNQELLTFIRADAMPNMPPKKIFGSSNQEFIEKRRLALEEYLRGVVKLSAVWSRQQIVNFLDSNTKCLLQLWTVDKMRRSQRTLSFASVASSPLLKEENKKLTKEMEEMQEKLAKYEMMLVQRVTGATTNTALELNAEVLANLYPSTGESTRMGTEGTESGTASPGSSFNSNSDSMNAHINAANIAARQRSESELE